MAPIPKLLTVNDSRPGVGAAGIDQNVSDITSVAIGAMHQDSGDGDSVVGRVEHRILELARQINAQKLSLEAIELDDLCRLAPHLIYVDLQRALPDDKLQEFLKRLTKAEIIKVTCSHISHFEVAKSVRILQLKVEGSVDLSIPVDAQLDQLEIVCRDRVSLSIPADTKLTKLKCPIITFAVPKSVKELEVDSSGCFATLSIPADNQLESLVVAEASIDLKKIKSKSGIRIHGDCNFCIQIEDKNYFQANYAIRSILGYEVVGNKISKSGCGYVSPFLEFSPRFFPDIASSIFTDSSYSLQLRRIILLVIARFLTSNVSESRSVEYYNYLKQVPLQELESIPEFSLYVKLRKEAEARFEHLEGIGWVFPRALCLQESLLKAEKYEDVSMPETVLIYVSQMEGFGDLITAAKMTHIILQKSPTTKIIMFHVTRELMVNEFSKDHKEFISSHLGRYAGNCSFGDTNSQMIFDSLKTVAIGVATVNARFMQLQNWAQYIP